MKYIYIFLLVLLGCADMSAQKFYVYQTQGDVTIKKGRASSPVKIRQLILGTQTIDLPLNSRVKLFDPQAQRFYMINGENSGVVNQILPTDKRSIEDLSKTYFSYVCRQLFGGKPIERMATTTAGQYRDIFNADTCMGAMDFEECSAASENSREYYVYQMLGDVAVCKGDTLVPIEPRMVLRPDDVLQVTENSFVRLFDSYNSQLILIRTPFVQTVEDIVRTENVGIMDLSEDVFAYVCRQVFGEEPIEQPHPQAQPESPCE